MTRNRDDFSATEALRAGLVALAAITVLMAGLGAAMSDHKRAAEERERTVAAGSLHFATGDARLADAGTARRG